MGAVCFNLLFLNGKRAGCSFSQFTCDQIDVFFQKKVRWASLLFFGLFGFGLLLSVFGIFVKFWMIKGSAFTLGNAVLFASLVFQILGLAVFEIFMLSNPSDTKLVWSNYQFFPLASFLLILICYLLGRKTSAEIERITRLQQLMEGDEDLDELRITDEAQDQTHTSWDPTRQSIQM